MEFTRSSGILVHPTCFPGNQGIGSLGEEARTFLRWLGAAGQRLWQVLPLGPTGYGASPYACQSAFAGNPNLIDLQELVGHGYLKESEVPAPPSGDPFQVDFTIAEAHKARMLQIAWLRFSKDAPQRHRKNFDAWCTSPDQAAWLEDYAIFAALKAAHNGAEWTKWERPLAARSPAALARWVAHHEDEVDYQRFLQWLFFHQWGNLRKFAADLGIQVVGDIPIFVAQDSADVWANPTLFHLDDDGLPTQVAGVPPDYFSETGQLWGNPLYRWEVMARSGYRWWVERFRQTFRQVDIVRVDHFRGFQAYWAIPAGEKTAVNGRWMPGPSAHFFATIQRELGDIPIIAEDLGEITDDVHQLRDRFNFPGMKILQFAFGSGSTNSFLPHNYKHPNWVVYTGTHDNDTTLGWWNALKEDAAELKALPNYLGHPIDPSTLPWDLMHLGWMSTAAQALAPLQDVLSLPGEARMNMPGREKGNWGWRFKADELTPALAEKLLTMSKTFGRTK